MLAINGRSCNNHYSNESCWLVWIYGISTIVGYLMPNPFYTNILNIYDLVCFGFMAYETVVGHLMPNPFSICILNIYDF